MVEVSGAEDAKTADGVVVAGEASALKAVAGRPVRKRAVATALPDDDKKWPLAVRVALITGSAAALWGVIFLGMKL